MIRYIKNVITGNIARWNETNNKLVSVLWQRAENFTDNYKLIAQEFISSSNIIVSSLLGPDRSKLTIKPIDQKDIKPLDINAFIEIYILVLNIYYLIFITLNPNNSEKIIESFGHLFDRKINPIIVNKENLKLEEKNKQIINQGINNLQNRITFLDRDDPILNYSLNSLIMSTYIENSKKFKA